MKTGKVIVFFFFNYALLKVTSVVQLLVQSEGQFFSVISQKFSHMIIVMRKERVQIFTNIYKRRV